MTSKLAWPVSTLFLYTSLAYLTLTVTQTKLEFNLRKQEDLKDLELLAFEISEFERILAHENSVESAVVDLKINSQKRRWWFP